MDEAMENRDQMRAELQKAWPDVPKWAKAMMGLIGGRLDVQKARIERLEERLGALERQVDGKVVLNK